MKRAGRRRLSAAVSAAAAAVALLWAALARPQTATVRPQTTTVRPGSSSGLYVTSHPAMGTVFTLYLYSDGPERAASISDEVFDEVDRLDQLLSNYKSTSELSRINRYAAGEAVTTDTEMFGFLSDATHWSQASDGAFDMTVGPLMRAWGFYEHGGRVPSEQELAGMRGIIGFQKVKLNETNRTVHFLADGVELDPGGIGKGFAVDAAVRTLKQDGVSAAMISAGGSTIYGLGAPPHERGWPVIVHGPLPSHEVLSTVYLRDVSLSSSDCTQKHFVANGQFYCHIMDPRTLRPVRNRVQVSVIHPSATASDALSNVAFVESPDETSRILSRWAPSAQALIVSRRGRGIQCVQYHWSDHVSSARCAVRTTSLERKK